MSTAAQTEGGRLTRARSKDAEPVPTNSNKKPLRPRRGRSASVEQQALDNMQQAPADFNGQALGAIAEEIDENLIAQQLRSAPAAPNNSNHVAMTNLPPNVPYQPFPSATLEAMKNTRARRRAPVPKVQQQPVPQASAPEAPMLQLQQMAQHAQHANQGHPQMEQPLNMVDPQLENVPQADVKRSIMDRQEGAVRVPWSDDSQPQHMQQHIAPQADMGEAGATQDDGFQHHAHSIGNVRPTVAPRRRGRPRQQPHPDSDLAYTPGSSSQAERDPSPRPSPPPSNYSQVQQQAKLYTAAQRKDRTPQKRKAWTSEECDALIDGIGRFGNAYATLKGEDMNHRRFLQDRSAEDLRHKARNMKFDYLKAGVVLPAGFDAVLLDKKFRDKLQAMGREYEQEQMRKTKKQKTKNTVAESQDEQDPNASQATQQ